LIHPREQNHIPSNRRGFEIAVNAARWVLQLARDTCKAGVTMESDMKNCWRVGSLGANMLALGFTSAMAQAPTQAYTPRTYECAANAHCSVFCQIDGEKQMQTGAPKTVTITPLAPNNYIVELVEQNGHVQFLYLAGTKVVCNIDGLTRKAGE
jgi:hypothetical protein